LNLTDGKYVWSGEALPSYIEETLKPKGMTYDEYLSLTRDALTTQDLTKKRFSYSIQQGDSASQIKLIWNIKLGSEANFAMKGLLELNRIQDSRSIIQDNLDFLTSRVTHLEEENKELKKMNNMLTTQRNDAVSQFDHLIIEKQCIETEMLSKFVDLLNEKKKKVRELKEDIKNRTFKRQTSIATLDGDDSDHEDGTCTQSLIQTGESQVTPLETTSLTFDNISDPTPTFDLLKDDDGGHYEPTVRKRYRGNNPESQHPSPPKLISSKSHGIITLSADSPAPKPRKGARVQDGNTPINGKTDKDKKDKKDKKDNPNTDQPNRTRRPITVTVKDLPPPSVASTTKHKTK